MVKGSIALAPMQEGHQIEDILYNKIYIRRLPFFEMQFIIESSSFLLFVMYFNLYVEGALNLCPGFYTVMKLFILFMNLYHNE